MVNWLMGVQEVGILFGHQSVQWNSSCDWFICLLEWEYHPHHKVCFWPLCPDPQFAQFVIANAIKYNHMLRFSNTSKTIVQNTNLSLVLLCHWHHISNIESRDDMRATQVNS